MANNRYIYSEVQNGRYQISRIPTIEKSDNDLYIYSRTGDRLDLLASQFYGDSRKWWIIASANNLGAGSYNIPAGLQIRIPDPEKSYTTLLKNAEDSK